MRDKDQLKAVVAWGLVIWIAAVVAGYYVFHKPFTPEFVISLMRAAWVVAVDAAIMTLAGGLGVRLLPGFDLHPLANLALQAAFGAGCLALGVLGFGALGLFYPGVGAAALILLALLLRKEVLDWLRGWRSVRTVWSSSGRIGKALGVTLAAVFVCTLWTALAPPLKFDALVYHLALPAGYLGAHRINYVPENMFWGMPQNAEMLYTWGASLGGLSAGPVLGWMAGLLTVLGLLGLITQKLAADAGWAGAAALLCGFTLAAGLSWGYADGWTVFFGLGFLICMVVWDQERRDSLLGLAGLLAGFALGAKYTAGVLLVSGAALVLIRRRASLQEGLKSLAWFCLPALLAFSPWLAKNFLATGNPIYPLLFPGGAMTPERIAFYHGGRPWGNWLDVFFLPLRSALWGAEGGPGYSASIGPLMLGFSLAAVLGWNSRPRAERGAVSTALVILLAAFLVWMAVGRFSIYLLQSRLYLAVFPAYAFLAAAGYAGLSRIKSGGVRLGVIAGALALLVTGFTAVELGLYTLDQSPARQVLGLETEESYLARNLGWFEPAMGALGALPAGSRVLMLWEPRSLYCQPLCMPDEVLDRWLVERHTPGLDGQPGAILQRWADQGFTHVLYYKLGAEFQKVHAPHYQGDDWLALEQLLAGLEFQASFGDTYVLYRLVR